MDWVLLDASKADAKHANVEDYEKMLVSIETRGFNIVYGNIREGWLKYY